MLKYSIILYIILLDLISSYTNQFEAQINKSDKIEGKIIDLDTQEEYANIRLENPSIFVKKNTRKINRNIDRYKSKCFKEQCFIFPQLITKYVIILNKRNDEFY